MAMGQGPPFAKIRTGMLEMWKDNIIALILLEMSDNDVIEERIIDEVQLLDLKIIKPHIRFCKV